MGKIMDIIFNLIDKIPFVNSGQIALAIIGFTIVMNIAMLPLTIRQQKFAKLQARMQPEMKAIQDKYKGRRDQEASMMMNEEMKALYTKYGVSQTGSCVQLLIQLPIMLALYRVIYAMPAYVEKIRSVYLGAEGTSLIGKLTSSMENFSVSNEIIQKLSSFNMYSRQFSAFSEEGFSLTDSLATVQNSFIDVLNRASTLDWEVFRVAINEKIAGMNDLILNAEDAIERYNSFFGLNVGNSPWYYLQNKFLSSDPLSKYDIPGVNLSGITVPQISMGVVIAAILVPVLAAVTQIINVKLMPTARNQGGRVNPDDQAAQMAQSMNTMNKIMPIMSAYFCFTFPIGIGLYWIAGSVVRSIEQVFVNRYIDRMDIDAQIAKNEEKYKEKLEKSREKTAQMGQAAQMNTRNLKSGDWFKSLYTDEEKEKALAEVNALYENEHINPDSLFAKANLVREYNNRDLKKTRSAKQEEKAEAANEAAKEESVEESNEQEGEA
ncbi:MAG: YidC/Oxa1 family membrane protein insertase [Lachnospiraceae bacterium]|nr:YidC/Oxa1 family membrane protein insertase [Lachnospiraceae bacterium]